MKFKTMNIRFLQFIVVLIILCMIKCKKDDEPEKSIIEEPTCIITNPNNGSIINQGDIISITVDATDNDGEISIVWFNIIGSDVESTVTFPYLRMEYYLL